MQSLIFIQNGKSVTNSRLVAQKFGKNHAHVLRDIQNLECSNHFRESNFGLSQYDQKMPTGGTKQVTQYIITRDGFTFLAMGFTGKQAATFKEEYINAFNEMEAALRHPALTDDMIDQAVARYMQRHAVAQDTITSMTDDLRKFWLTVQDLYQSGMIVAGRDFLIVNSFLYIRMQQLHPLYCHALRERKDYRTFTKYALQGMFQESTGYFGTIRKRFPDGSNSTAFLFDYASLHIQLMPPSDQLVLDFSPIN